MNRQTIKSVLLVFAGVWLLVRLFVEWNNYSTVAGLLSALLYVAVCGIAMIELRRGSRGRTRRLNR